MIIAKIESKSKKFNSIVCSNSTCNCGSCNCNCGSQYIDTSVDKLILEQL